MPNDEATEREPSHKISGPLHLYNCEVLRQGLLRYFETSPVISLDLSEISDCDLAGLQLICSARRTATELGKPFHVQVSQHITGVMEGFGLPHDYFATKDQRNHE